jgi:NAD-specific glutamate dehydrogenase
VSNASERFVSIPEHITTKFKPQTNQRKLAGFQKQFDFTHMETEDDKQKRLRFKLKRKVHFVDSSNTDAFVRQYAFLVNKILSTRQDPFLTNKR